MDTRPIGIFDSGIGGLTVVKAVKELLPKESIVYLGDTARVPYGTRSKETVTQFALDDVNFLLEQDVKCIVIACNTVASQAYEAVCKHSSVPVISVVDAGVSEVENDSRVLVLATSGTVSSNAYKVKIEVSKKISVTEIACPLFVPAIEEGEVAGELIELLITKYLHNINTKAYDSLILGCTHYPLIKSSIEKYVGKDMKVIDSSTAVARLLEKTLKDKNLFSSTTPSYEYFLTDVTDAFLKTAKSFLGETIKNDVRKVEL